MKGIAGFYYVDTGDAVYECKARGSFKNKNKKGAAKKPYVGDRVQLDMTDDTPVITGIKERTSCFDRPPVANIEQFIIVSACVSPDPNLAVVDRFITMAEMNDIEVVICFTKADLASEELKERLKNIYENVYPVIFIDARKREDAAVLASYLNGKKTALAGPSGVGKSTVTNSLISDAPAETGEVSEKTRRGRHTTRHVELFRLADGGMLFDTPGFTSFDVPQMEEDRLRYLFREFSELNYNCKFAGCMHQNEPGCAVKAALAAGKISLSRYNSYISQLEEIRERKRIYRKR